LVLGGAAEARRSKGASASPGAAPRPSALRAGGPGRTMYENTPPGQGGGMPPPQQQQQQQYHHQQQQQQGYQQQGGGQQYHQQQHGGQGQQPAWEQQAAGAASQFIGGMAGGGLQGKVVADLGMQKANQFANDGKKVIISNLEKYISLTAAREYFQVDNKYVLDKLLFVLAFPILILGMKNNPKWQYPREFSRTDKGARVDMHSPDLYIPAMAFVTYIILAAFALGTHGVFNPDVLGTYASFGMMVVLLELAILKFGAMLLNGPALVNLDVIAYCGYKFVGLSLLVLINLTLGSWSTALYYIIFLYLAGSMGFFLIKSLEYVMGVTDDMSCSTKEDKVKVLRLVVGALQLPMFFFLMPGLA